MYPDKFVSTVGDVPEVEHWAIIQTDGVHIPGDERSRTNPGHGYPAHTQNYISYRAYLTEEKLMLAIKELEDTKYGKKDYKVIKVTPMKVAINVSVALK